MAAPKTTHLGCTRAHTAGDRAPLSRALDKHSHSTSLPHGAAGRGQAKALVGRPRVTATPRTPPPHCTPSQRVPWQHQAQPRTKEETVSRCRDWVGLPASRFLEGSRGDQAPHTQFCLIEET